MAKPMPSSIPLITDELRLKELLDEYLNEKNDSFTVIGCIGTQGSGKSTLLSMLAGNNPRDKYRQYIFRPCSKDTVDAGFYQTAGLHIYITANRTIFIDCAALNCGAAFEEMIKKSKSELSGLALLKTFQSQELSLVSIMFEICHILLLTIDWFIDINAVQELLRAALYSEFNLQKFTDFPKTTNLVVVQQRVQVHDYEAGLIKERSQLIRSIFKDSRLNVCGGISMAGLGFTEFTDCEPDVNYVLMDELPQWTKEGFSNEPKLLAIPYGSVVKALRTALISAPKNQFRTLKSRRPLRRVRPAKGCMTAPTADPEVLKLNEKQNEVTRRTKKDDIESEADSNKLFNAEHMPNIASRRCASPPREPWNETLSILSPPNNEQSALNSLEVLRSTYLQRSADADDYVRLLLPETQPQKLNEKKWFEYVRQVLEITVRNYETRYFISNNGRLVPRIIRKLRDSTKTLVKGDEVSTTKSGRSRRGGWQKGTRQGPSTSKRPKARNVNVLKTTGARLLDGLAAVGIVESAAEPETGGSTSAMGRSGGNREREQNADNVDSEGEFSSISAFSFSEDDDNNAASDLSLNSSDDSSSENSESDRGDRSERRGFRRRVVSNES